MARRASSYGSPANRFSPRSGRQSNNNGDTHNDYTIALLILLASVLSATVSLLGALLSSEAADQWQTAVRLDIRDTTALVEDVRYVYADQAPAIFQTDVAEARTTALDRAAHGSNGLPSATAAAEAAVERQLATLMRPRSQLSPAQDLTYRRADGTFDLGKRLADEHRLPAPPGVPTAEEARAAGNRAGGEVARVMAVLLPVAAVFELALLAQWRPGRRQPLLRGGYALLVVSVVLLALGVWA
jgi:hypothetical protein